MEAEAGAATLLLGSFGGGLIGRALHRSWAAGTSDKSLQPDRNKAATFVQKPWTPSGFALCLGGGSDDQCRRWRRSFLDDLTLPMQETLGEDGSDAVGKTDLGSQGTDLLRMSLAAPALVVMVGGLGLGL